MTGVRTGKCIETALIADDHGVTRFGIRQFLRTTLAVRTVIEAQNFEEALQQLSRHGIELAIFDLDMPGLASARDLVQVRRRWPATRVVVLSGFETRAHILAALEAGVHGYIIKSASMEHLAERLGYVMSGEIYVPPCLAEPGEAIASLETTAGGAERGGEVPQLSQRQQQVLRGLVRGMSNKQICKELDLAEGTVKMHVGNVLKALGARSRSHAVTLGRRLVE
jgi:DNA-binding NarL/FixJ family response regulator